MRQSISLQWLMQKRVPLKAVKNRKVVIVSLKTMRRAKVTKAVHHPAPMTNHPTTLMSMKKNTPMVKLKPLISLG